MRNITIAIGLLAIAGLARAGIVAIGPAAKAPPEAADDTIHAKDADDAGNQVGLKIARELIDQKQPQLAVGILDKTIAGIEKREAASTGPRWCAHTEGEATLYLKLAAAAGQDRPTAMDSPLCDAVFLRGYAWVDLGKTDLAEADFKRAIEMAPSNPHYLSEMGELQAHKHAFDAALAYYRRAEAAAPTCSPAGTADVELTRAWRGIGYVEVELGQLDEAEAHYRHCLELDPHDEKARGELGYVLEMKAKARAAS